MNPKHFYGLAGAWTIDIAAIAGIAGATAVAYFAVYRPTMMSRDAVEAQTLRIRELDEQCRAREALLRSASTDLTTLNAEWTAIGLTLESENGINRRLSRLTELAEKVGLKVTQLTPAKAVQGPRSKMVSIAVAGRARYPQAVAFLRLLHAEMRDTAVARLAVSSTPENIDGRADVAMQLVWHALAGNNAGNAGGGDGAASVTTPASADSTDPSARTRNN